MRIDVKLKSEDRGCLHAAAREIYLVAKEHSKSVIGIPVPVVDGRVFRSLIAVSDPAPTLHEAFEKMLISTNVEIKCVLRP